MKRPLFAWLLAGLLSASSSSCIFVHVRGDLHHQFMDGDEGFPGLMDELGSCLVDPTYELDLDGSIWGMEATWTIAFAEGSDGAKAFHVAREAVLARITRQGGKVFEQRDKGPHAWECEFVDDDGRGEASVELVLGAEPGAQRPHQLEVSWEE